jgi:large conductance mechanosensitive channel
MEDRLRREFMEFMKNYGVIGLAIAVIIGGKANAMVSTLVDGILMPIITIFLPAGDWREATLELGAVSLVWGPFVAAVIDFVIVAFVVYLIAKKVMKEEVVAKK